MFDLDAFEADVRDLRERLRALENRGRPARVAAVTRDERLRFATPRNKFETCVSTVRALVDATDFRLNGLSVAEMDESLAIAAALEPLLQDVRFVLGGLERAVEDSIDRERSNAYRIFLAFYSALAPVTKLNGELQRMYGEIVELFRHRKRAGEPVV